MSERNIRDMREKAGEFKVNITWQFNEFINNHEAANQNIMEIRKLSSDMKTQKKEIRK